MTNSDCVEKGLRPGECDRIFDVLADRRRRHLLRHLVDEGIAQVDDLTNAVTEYVDADRSRTEVALVHTHLPKLDEQGIVDYDRRSETVRYDGHCFLEGVLERTADADRTSDE